MKAYLPFLICLPLFGCGAGDGTGLDQDGQPIDPDAGQPAPQPPSDPNAIQPTLASIQEKVLTPICTQCHAGGNAPLGLQMDDLETSQANLINVDSATNPQFKRVLPGDPDQSFFYLKIIGDPSAGNQMPLGQTPLSADTQQVIRTWIENGAPIDSAQATVAAKRVEGAGDQLNIALSFSQPVERSSLSAHDIEFKGFNRLDQDVSLNSKVSLTWHSDSRANVLLDGLETDIVRVKMSLNQPHLSTVMSQSGNWLDGDYDGFAGGAVSYEYSVNF